MGNSETPSWVPGPHMALRPAALATVDAAAAPRPGTTNNATAKSVRPGHAGRRVLDTEQLAQRCSLRASRVTWRTGPGHALDHRHNCTSRLLFLRQVQRASDP